jgi:O-antigen/teichoic acid export membrane protein
MVGTARGGALNLIGAVTNAILQFVLVVVMTRGLGARGTGVFFGAIALFTILSTASQFGSDSGVIRTIPSLIVRGRRSEIGAVVSVALTPVLIAGTALAVATYALAPQLASLFMRDVPTEEAARLIRVLSPFLPLTTATLVLLAVSRGFGTMVPTVVVENFSKPALRLALVGLAIAIGAGVFGATVAWAIPIIIGLIVAGWVVRVRLREHDHVRPTGGSGGEVSAGAFWRFSLPRGIAGILEVSLGWFDILLLGAFRSATEVGVYAAVSRTAVMALFALRATSMAIAPRLSALLSQGRRSQAQTLYQVMTWWLILLAWPIYITLAVFSPFLLGVFGTAFTAGSTALTILSVAMLVNMATGNVNAVLLMAGKSTWNLANASVVLALNVGLNLLLIPPYGIEGAAIAWAISIVVLNLAAAAEVKLLLGLEPFGRGYGLATGAASGCFGVPGVVVSVALGQSVASFSLYLVVSLASYAIVLYKGRRVLHLDVLREAVDIRAGGRGP